MTGEWVVLLTKAYQRDGEQVTESNPHTFPDEDAATEAYTQLVREYSNRMPDGCAWVDLYLENRRPNPPYKSKVHAIRRHHRIVPDGHGKGRPDEYPVTLV